MQEKFEKHLPFALVDLAITVDLGMGFEESMEKVSKKNYGMASKEFSKIVKSVKEKGATLEQALKEMSRRIDSLNARRVASQLDQIYLMSDTKGGEQLRIFAAELMNSQKNQAKAFSGKTAFYALLFVAFSALVPALFQAFLVAGSLLLEINIKPLQALALIIVGFPAANILILGLIWSKTPEFLK